uniref:Uncharacterized protein n=1 Tax=Meloidogyne enterolobii TaxID=390850 RepID=A0A6V7X3H5_MELEN|nr:unnamed protein product [Meloidogyne enterolobii]
MQFLIFVLILFSTILKEINCGNFISRIACNLTEKNFFKYDADVHLLPKVLLCAYLDLLDEGENTKGMITGKKLNESNSIIIQIIYISQFYLILTSLDNKRELDNLIR